MKIEILYPEVCCLFGDIMNAEYIANCIPGAEIIKTALGEKPAFLDGNADIAFLCSMPEYAQVLVRDEFAKYRAELDAAIGRGAVLLCTGNAQEVFFKYIEDADGTRTEMLGLFDLYAKRDFMNRFNGLYLGKLGELDIVGFKSQFCHVYGNERNALFETVRGVGRNPGESAEGVRRGNLLCSAVIGPLVVLNPPFARYLLGLMGAKGASLYCEEAAMDAYTLRLREFSEPDRSFDY